MPDLRTIILLLAPLPVISGSMSLAKWAHEDPYKFATRNEAVAATNADGFETTTGFSVPTPHPWVSDQSKDLKRRSQALANSVVRQLPKGDTVIVRAPLVLGGNLSPEKLDQWHKSTILPAIESIQRDYLQASIADPITVLLFRDESTYRQAADRLFGRRRVSIYGFYLPYCRTVLINLGAGGGTIVHELTHALLDFDFPNVPIWFNEGLGSLHEHCTFERRDNQTVIRPKHNWRLQILQTAMVEGRMMPTWELIERTDFDGRDQALLYAHVRYFCFYLHSQGKLRDFYTEFRNAVANDPQGKTTLRHSFPRKTWPQIERDFRVWVLNQSQPSAG